MKNEDYYDNLLYDLYAELGEDGLSSAEEIALIKKIGAVFEEMKREGVSFS